MKINVNDMVTVKLTDRGRQVLKEQSDLVMIKGFRSRYEGNEESITRPLWEIIALFGSEKRAWMCGNLPNEQVFGNELELLGHDPSPKPPSYAICAMATRKVETPTRTEFYASTNLVVRQVGSEDEAVGLGHRLAREQWPLDEGWVNHQVTVCLIP